MLRKILTPKHLQILALILCFSAAAFADGLTLGGSAAGFAVLVLLTFASALCVWLSYRAPSDERKPYRGSRRRHKKRRQQNCGSVSGGKTITLS